MDSPQDQRDENPSDGICDTDNFGCTLRAAIEQANAFTGDPSDTIVVPAGNYDIGSALTAADEHADRGGLATEQPRSVGDGFDRVFDIDRRDPARPNGGHFRLDHDGGVAERNNDYFGGNLMAQTRPSR